MRAKIILIISLILCRTAVGLTFLGPPSSNIRQGEFGIGFDYSHSETDISVEDIGELEGVEADALLGRIIFGVADHVEWSFSPGFAEVEDLGNEFAWGFGTRGSFTTSDDVDWGAVFQFVAFYADDSITIGGYRIAGELELYKFQFGFGPTLKFDNLHIYGGPIVHYVTGEIEFNVLGTPVNFDIDREFDFGAYVGLSLQVDEYMSLSAEYQKTSDAEVFAAGLIHRFGKN